MTRLATMLVTTKRKKKSAWPPKFHGILIWPDSIALTFAAMSPPPRLARKLEINQMPMRSLMRRTGAVRVTQARPVGEMQSSPTVCQK